MGELTPHPYNPFVDAILGAIKLTGCKWVPVGDEGPRAKGYCVYCREQCYGTSKECESRVWNESVSPRK